VSASGDVAGGAPADVPGDGEAFEYRLRVRYGECDAQAVVFNARYGDYVDIAVSEYIRVLFGDYQRLLERDLDTQVVSLAINWKASARFDDVLSIRVLPGKLGTTSFAIQCVMRRQRDGVLVATAEVVYVMISVAQRGKAVIPDDLRAVLLAGAPGSVVSHAGDG
jgi:acyl-CoA thioester hydrolase